MKTNVRAVRALKGKPLRKPTPFPGRPPVGIQPGAGSPAVGPLAKQYSARAQRASKKTSY
jgi:hypothetical protein